MPRVNGFELIAAITTRSPEIPILVFTGSRGGRIPEGARVHVLAKPCCPDVLLARVALILQQNGRKTETVAS